MKYRVIPFEECTKKQQNCRIAAFISVITAITIAIAISAINSFYGWIEMAAASSALVEAEEKAYLAERDVMLMEQIEKEAAEKAESEAIETDPLDGYEPSPQIMALISMPSLRERFGPEFPEDEVEGETEKLLETSVIDEVKKIAKSHGLSENDIIILAKTLYGEANSVKSTCERSMVIWTVINRVDAKQFPNTITEVCTAPQQFTGYSANHPVTMENLLLVDDVLTRWEKEKASETNVGRTLPNDIYYFRADSDPATGEWHNKFFKYAADNKTRIYYDRDNPIANPYAD